MTYIGVLSRAAAVYCESFVFSVGVGDDFAMRTSIETIESLRTQLFDALQNCRLPKVSFTRPTVTCDQHWVQ